MWFRNVALVALLALSVQPAFAQTTVGVVRSRVAVTSASQGTLIAQAIRYSARVQVPFAAAVPIWVCEANPAEVNHQAGTCPGVTSPNGCVQVLQGGTYVHSVNHEGWAGSLCALLDSQTSAVDVDVSTK